MALTDEGTGGIPATMLVGPATGAIGGGMPYPIYTGGGQGNNGFGNDGGWWIILLFIILLAGGAWGNNNGNGGGGFIGNGGGVGGLYPWMNQAEITTNGFQNQLLNDNVTSIRDGINALSTQLCDGFAGVEQGANARQIANMNQAFGMQTAMMQGFNALGTQFGDCCCENRLANCQTQNVIQNEGNMTRFADANNTRDIIENQTRGIQTVIDKLCQLELDGKQDRINDLERQLTAANFQASQVAQTARLERSNNEVIDGLYNRLATCPVGTMPVYGNQPIFSCPQNSGCGCGCSGNNF